MTHSPRLNAPEPGTERHFLVRKDGWTPSMPWMVDVIWKDGPPWISWSGPFKTRKSALAHITAVDPNADVRYASRELIPGAN